ncbi:MAG: flavin reductase family protein [Proteobacteria bacterium]|nr:flavin reductase family protein [Pseudomonadota bacterium]
MTVDAEQFKAGLARWASGVTIVTARAGDRVHGMTVSAFSSVSLDPPLVLVCADKTSNTLPVIEDAGCFAANVLARGQEELSNRFASEEDEWRRFEGLEVESGATGAPLIVDALANIDCKVVASHDAGDHVIYVGQVEQIVTRDREPLLFYQGRYCSVAPEAPGG